MGKQKQEPISLCYTCGSPVRDDKCALRCEEIFYNLEADQEKVIGFMQRLYCYNIEQERRRDELRIERNRYRGDAAVGTWTTIALLIFMVFYPFFICK
jgi:predicted nucleic acid-binding Zn ribbon protein